jgi:penicillin-binding protein 1A
MNKRIRKIIILLWAIPVFSFGGLMLLILMVQNDTFGWFGGLPSLQALERPDPALSSEIISSDGVNLGKYFRKNRVQVTYDELSPELVTTLLVTEDLRFKRHSGIDLRGMIRAFFGVITLSDRGGGSTITQQLAKNLYTQNPDLSLEGKIGKLGRYPRRLIQKVKEWIISIKLERAYTKEEILAMYLNTVEFGSNSYGIHVAAKTFFDKHPSQLNYQESAVLVGVINAPTRYSPVQNPENAMRKRTEVLYNLHKYGVIERALFDSLKTQPIELKYVVDNQNEGLATYFRTVIRNFLMDWCKQNGYDLFNDGLKIYTTIDSRMQRYAEEAMTEHMSKLQQTFEEHWGKQNPWIDDRGREIKGFLQDAIKRTDAYKNLKKRFVNKTDSIEFYLKKPRKMRVFTWDGEVDTTFSSYDSLKYYKRFLQSGFMAMEPHTGHIKAWVGGINHKYFKFDHVKQGKRQPGSTFKAIVYTEAIRQRYSPCMEVADNPVTFNIPGQDPPTWTPQNANGVYSGETMTLRQAMAKSVNSITAYMMREVTPERVVDIAKRLGIESPLDPVPSLCLGVSDVSLYELLGAYATFVNRGIHTEPFFVTRIEDKNGNLLQEFVPKKREAINEETAYIMLYMLRGGTEESGGTGLGLSRDVRAGNEIAAKTGTTNNGSDGWFMGLTHDLAAGGWCGGDDRSIHFRNWAMGAGAKTAMPVWDKFMTKVYADPSLPYRKGSFPKPGKPLSVELDCNKYKQLPGDSLEHAVRVRDIF